MTPPDAHLQIGALLFEGLDQIDLTGPFEVLSRLPNATYRVFAKTLEPVRDVRGLRLTPDALLEDAPQLDVLHIPGGHGQEALMDDDGLPFICCRFSAPSQSTSGWSNTRISSLRRG
jgi:cyclohexyl-isocyanide hydratase